MDKVVLNANALTVVLTCVIGKRCPEFQAGIVVRGAPVHVTESLDYSRSIQQPGKIVIDACTLVFKSKHFFGQVVFQPCCDSFNQVESVLQRCNN